MAERVFGNEVTFTFRYKTPDGGRTRIQKCMEVRISTSGIQNAEEETGGKAVKEYDDSN